MLYGNIIGYSGRRGIGAWQEMPGKLVTDASCSGGGSGGGSGGQCLSWEHMPQYEVLHHTRPSTNIAAPPLPMSMQKQIRRPRHITVQYIRAEELLYSVLFLWLSTGSLRCRPRVASEALPWVASEALPCVASMCGFHVEAPHYGLL
jgi:hypothetical protein